ncbi:hypothetical protein Tco_1524252 [Tanacetum coccineum]
MMAGAFIIGRSPDVRFVMNMLCGREPSSTSESECITSSASNTWSNENKTVLRQRKKTSEYEAYVSGESSSGQVNEEERGPSTSGNQEQEDDYDFWTDSYASDDDEISKISLNDDDIEEQTSRWVNKCVKKFNPYARYGVKHWKNPHAKIFYIRKQKQPGKPKEEVYSNSKIIQPDYKNLNKNDIEDMYLLIMNGKKVNLTAPTISFPGVEKHGMFSIIYEPVHGIIYKNSKKEKRVMRQSEIHKFCDATLNRVLEGLKSYNNDVKYGYVQRELTNDEVEYLKLFEEEIEVRLKYRNQMRRWEMYVNGRPLGPRRERPE